SLGQAIVVELAGVGQATVRFGKVMLRAPLDGTRQHAAHGGVAGGRVTLVLRPEAIRLHRLTPHADNVLPGQIRTASFLGTLARYWVEAAGLTWIVDVPSPGETVYGGEVFLEI